MPPKKAQSSSRSSPQGRKTGGIVARKRKPSGFVLPGGEYVGIQNVKQYGGAHQTGDGWFSDLAGKVWKGAKSVYNVGKKVYDVGKGVYDKLQDTKAISTMAGLVPHAGAQALAAAARQRGFGRQRGGRMTKGNAALLV